MLLCEMLSKESLTALHAAKVKAKAARRKRRKTIHLPKDEKVVALGRAIAQIEKRTLNSCLYEEAKDMGVPVRTIRTLPGRVEKAICASRHLLKKNPEYRALRRHIRARSRWLASWKSRIGVRAIAKIAAMKAVIKAEYSRAKWSGQLREQKNLDHKVKESLLTEGLKAMRKGLDSFSRYVYNAASELRTYFTKIDYFVKMVGRKHRQASYMGRLAREFALCRS